MSILVIRFCNNVFSVKHLLWQSTGTLNCQFILFLIISFSRFQYSNLHFESLNLKIQDNFSHFSVFITGIKLDLFYSFSAIPHHYGSYLKIQAQVCPICQNLINPKQLGYDFMATFQLVRLGVLGGLMV